MENMLDCTWNDMEAQTALRRMLLKEQTQQKIAVGNPKLARKERESELTRLSLKRIAGTGGHFGSF
jgi:hypothetical protein